MAAFSDGQLFANNEKYCYCNIFNCGFKWLSRCSKRTKIAHCIKENKIHSTEKCESGSCLLSYASHVWNQSPIFRLNISKWAVTLRLFFT